MAWQRSSPLRLLLRLRKHEEDISREFVKYNSQRNMASRSCCVEGQNKHDQTKRKICRNYHRPATSCSPYQMNPEGKFPLDLRSGDWVQRPGTGENEMPPEGSCLPPPVLQALRLLRPGRAPPTHQKPNHALRKKNFPSWSQRWVEAASEQWSCTSMV